MCFTGSKKHFTRHQSTQAPDQVVAHGFRESRNAAQNIAEGWRPREPKYRDNERLLGGIIYVVHLGIKFT